MWIHQCLKSAKPHILREVKSGEACKKCGEREAPPEINALPLALEITEGASYIDEPITRKVQAMVGRTGPVDATVKVGYRHVKLRWVTPGPGGKLIPKN